MKLKGGKIFYKIFNFLNINKFYKVEKEKDFLLHIQTKFFSSFLNLNEEESAIKWVRENLDDLPKSFYDENYDYTLRPKDQLELSESEFREKMSVGDTYERISEYRDKYLDIKDKDSVEIYRALCVNQYSDIDFNKIGIWWSFEESGVGCYGGNSKNKEFILTGLVNPKYIDWEKGFYSFLYYGENQWECAIIEESPIQITAINGEELKNINGIV